MSTPRYKYTSKYVIEKVNNNKLLHIFLKKKKIYNKFIDSCLKANTSCYFIDRQSFDKHPFMAFSWAASNMLNNDRTDWCSIAIEFDKYKLHIYEEI